MQAICIKKVCFATSIFLCKSTTKSVPDRERFCNYFVRRITLSRMMMEPLTTMRRMGEAGLAMR